MRTKTTLRSLRMTPRKVRLLIDLIRGLSVDKALAQLAVSKKTAARPVAKLLQSAVANAAHNHNIKKDSLVIVAAAVDGGATLHRWTPKAHGRATPIRKRTAHISLVLEGVVDETKSKIKNQKSKIEGDKKIKAKAEPSEKQAGERVKEIKGEKV